MFKKGTIAICLSIFLLASCKKDETVDAASLGFQFKFNPTQARLDNLGNPSTIPAANAAQTPVFHKMSAHYIELVPSEFTLLGAGAVVYRGLEVAASNDGLTKAIDFPKAVVAAENSTFLRVPFKDIPPGTYKYIRVSVTYQNYDVRFNIK